jgi:hypothetical protein
MKKATPNFLIIYDFFEFFRCFVLFSVYTVYFLPKTVAKYFILFDATASGSFYFILGYSLVKKI